MTPITISDGTLSGLSGDVEMRWVDTYFPFTDPSFELEIFFKVCIPHRMRTCFTRQNYTGAVMVCTS